jgi:hypothetical protein
MLIKLQYENNKSCPGMIPRASSNADSSFFSSSPGPTNPCLKQEQAQKIAPTRQTGLSPQVCCNPARIFKGMVFLGKSTLEQRFVRLAGEWDILHPIGMQAANFILAH